MEDLVKNKNGESIIWLTIFSVCLIYYLIKY